MAGHSPLPPAGPSTRHLGSTKSPSCGSEAQVTAWAVPWEGDRGIIVSHRGFWNAKQKLGVRSGETNMKIHWDKAAGPSGPQRVSPASGCPAGPGRREFTTRGGSSENSSSGQSRGSLVGQETHQEAT